jgi:hypothetical protein
MARIDIVDVKGIPLDRRAVVRAAISLAGSELSEDHEAWVVPSRRPPAYAVRITGPRGFYREIKFAGRETETEIAISVRKAVES